MEQAIWGCTGIAVYPGDDGEGVNVSDQQTIAILNPCEFAEQCNNQRYAKAYRVGKFLCTALLTVNVGEE